MYLFLFTTLICKQVHIGTDVTGEREESQITNELDVILDGINVADTDINQLELALFSGSDNQEADAASSQSIHRDMSMYQPPQIQQIDNHQNDYRASFKYE